MTYEVVPECRKQTYRVVTPNGEIHYCDAYSPLGLYVYNFPEETLFSNERNGRTWILRDGFPHLLIES